MAAALSRSGRRTDLVTDFGHVPDTSATVGGSPIRTPDRRVRLFVSSTLQELAAERAAARDAINTLHLTAVMFETGARHHPARELYRSYLAQSDVFVGIYWQKYGWVAPGEDVSGLEDEYSLSGDMPKLIYVKAAHVREPRLVALLARVKSDDQLSYKHFGTAAELADLLADDLAILLTERFDRREVARPTRALRQPTLPVPPTELVGRESEIERGSAALNDPAVRLVTLLGPGGIGKTRLALELARKWAAALPGVERPAWFVDLAPVREPSLWADAVAQALGIRPEGSGGGLDLIIDRLLGLSAVIVFDNFEQVAAAAPELARFLTSCPGLTALVTSRSALRLRGETEIPLAPLGLPGGEPDFEAVRQSPAVQLFIARAAAVRPGFQLTSANASAVAQLCRLLDGIPLALELAAAQLRVLNPAALVRRLDAGLDQSLDLTAGSVDLPDRQRTLRVTIQWSYSLLTGSERTMLARLSVLTGAWTLQACEAVAVLDGDPDAATTLNSLVAQSLVRTDESDAEELRFRMLDIVRAYAAEALAHRGEVESTSVRLARYLVGVVKAVEDDLQGPRHGEVAKRLDRELDEIRSAIDWALHNDDAQTVTWFLSPLFSYWDSRGLLPVTHDIAEKAAKLPSAAYLPAYAAALLLSARGMAMVIVGQATSAEPLMRRSLDAANELADPRLQAYALFGLGVAVVQRSLGDAAQFLDDAIPLFRDIGDGWGLALALSTRGQWALLAGDHATARAIHIDALAAADAIHNDHLRAQIRDMLGLDAVAAADLTAAREQYSIAAAIHTAILDYEGSAYGLSGLAGLALAQGRPVAAARLVGASQRARDVVGIAVWPGMQSVNHSRTTAIVDLLGTAAFTDAVAEGSRLNVTDALAYGLAATAADIQSDPYSAFPTRPAPH